MSKDWTSAKFSASELESVVADVLQRTQLKTNKEVLEKVAGIPASELEASMDGVLRDVMEAPREVIAQERAFYGDDNLAEVTGAFVSRRLAERSKELGNALFAEGKYADAMLKYTVALGILMTREKRSPLDRRLMAVLQSNMSACSLAMDDPKEAVAHAVAALKEDDTFEKAWLRLGAALEASPGRRAEALDAYREISSNPVAAARIAALTETETPVVITTEGLTGLPERSIHTNYLALCLNPLSFFGGGRIFLPSEPLLPGEARETAYDYCLRGFMASLALSLENCDPDVPQHSRHVFASESNPKDQLWLDVIGTFVTLRNVADDGRSRKVTHNSSDVPAVFVGVWTDKGKPPPVKVEPQLWHCGWSDLKPVRDMLMRNAALLSEESKKGLRVPGFTVSLMTHMAAPELDFSIMEGCAMPECRVKCAAYRCARCYVARYCGKEHMTAHWKVHKARCVPLAQREPKIELPCWHGYLDNPVNAKAIGVDCIAAPQKTFPGVVVVKIQLFGDLGVKICDPHGVLIVSGVSDAEWFVSLEKLLLARPTFRNVGYFDADMSQEGRLVIFLDHNWRCTW
jgi:hypothetical protein